MSKTFIGPQLRQLRRQNKHTQAQMAQRLGISPAYVNLLENNQRSLSVQVLVALTEAYGVDMRSLVTNSEATKLADLRTAVRDPVFADDPPDLTELRSALDHAPTLVDRFLHLHQTHRAMTDQFRRLAGRSSGNDLQLKSPETAIHDVFRANENHFAPLEDQAENLRARLGGDNDDMYALLKRHLRLEHGIASSVRKLSDMPSAFRLFRETDGVVYLSEALDHANRIFQLAHVIGLLEARDTVQEYVSASGITEDAGRARLTVELTNYFAAAVLMPYSEFLSLAEATRYDIDRVAAGFGTSFEMVCQRLTTLQRDGQRGIPFFFLRVDRAGNVSKRFNATTIALAEEGGACPVWDIHGAFQVPGQILPQFVEMPDKGRFFTLSRTSDRPMLGPRLQARRLVVAIGCDTDHAPRIGYARRFNMSDTQLFAPIGTSCHVCPRQACSQRAHQPLHVTLPVDANRRGQTRYES
ncbi:short-chain fatty acyl-CoA regulator family protein [Marivita sp. S6314]|uniref:helix-turn-helix domain-containing protein n=1 Tax=Marivita sp. S6314 TaxID=2926406 RepID=UPI001FF21FEA|nr:XRE family transcriptional regulator [Marivita sp. S6314]MCK0149225.1 short-chain fatty acyl-CoA regulator family protein [Marivita sp. S6314]